MRVSLRSSLFFLAKLPCVVLCVCAVFGFSYFFSYSRLSPRHMPKKVDFFFSGGQAMPASEGYLNTVGAT